MQRRQCAKARTDKNNRAEAKPPKTVEITAPSRIAEHSEAVRSHGRDSDGASEAGIAQNYSISRVNHSGRAAERSAAAQANGAHQTALFGRPSRPGDGRFPPGDGRFRPGDGRFLRLEIVCEVHLGTENKQDSDADGSAESTQKRCGPQGAAAPDRQRGRTHDHHEQVVIIDAGTGRQMAGGRKGADGRWGGLRHHRPPLRLQRTHGKRHGQQRIR